MMYLTNTGHQLWITFVLNKAHENKLLLLYFSQFKLYIRAFEKHIRYMDGEVLVIWSSVQFEPGTDLEYPDR